MAAQSISDRAWESFTIDEVMTEVPLPVFVWPKSLLGYDTMLPSPSDNLALDEALLGDVEADSNKACLRFWEPQEYFVVLGRSNRAETEVNRDVCASEGIRVLRRASGGGTVLIGPGCLCYSLALPLSNFHRTLGVSGVTKLLMERTAVSLREKLAGVEVCGTSDLVWNGRKFSGNAQRWLKQSFLHQGTLLYDFDLSKLSRCLAAPTRQPEYRLGRRHEDFVANIPLSSAVLREVLCSTWHAELADCSSAVLDEAARIRDLRYSSADWQHGSPVAAP